MYKKFSICAVLIICSLFITYTYQTLMADKKSDIDYEKDALSQLRLGNDKSFYDFIKWRVTRKNPKWPTETKEPEKYDKPPANMDGDAFRVSMVGHSTVLIQTHGLNILTDPIWSDRASPVGFAGPKRVILPGIKFAELPKIDVVIVSHNHYDHMDKETIKMLIKNHNPLFITPTKNDIILKGFDSQVRVIPLDWHEDAKINDAVKIWCYPAKHWSGRYVLDANDALWGAFIIETNLGNIYFGGDTGFGDGKHFEAAREKFKNFQLALLPIGAFEPKWFMKSSHVDPKEAVEAAMLLNAKMSIAIHYDVFPLADDEFGVASKLLKSALNRLDAPDFKELNPGQHSIVKW
jgi:L-ascorbate metabolism protein UlaG (beta-lactamase superfamily)